VLKLSPSMQAVTKIVERDKVAFEVAAEKIVELSTARTSAILDLRNFAPANSANSGAGEGDSERARREGRPQVFYDQNSSHGLNETVEGGSPIQIVGSFGLGADALDSLKNLTMANITRFEDVIRRIKQVRLISAQKPPKHGPTSFFRSFSSSPVAHDAGRWHQRYQRNRRPRDDSRQPHPARREGG
jgi:hypothetical protein